MAALCGKSAEDLPARAQRTRRDVARIRTRPRAFAAACAAAALVAFGSPGIARTPSRGRPATTIDALCAARAARALRGPKQRVARIFGDPTRDSSAWRIADAALLHRIARDPDLYSEVATVWRDGGAIAIVSVESRSLDYREDASYCFRIDGSLARLSSTSSGTRNLDDEFRYFDAAGRILASTSRLALLHPQPHDVVSPDVRPSKPIVFRSVRSLPFYGLLARTPPSA